MNTSFQENGSNASVPEEKEVDDGIVKTGSEVNGTHNDQDDEKQCTTSEQDSEKCQGTTQEQKDSISGKKEALDVNSVPENVPNSTEEPAEEVAEKQLELLDKKTEDSESTKTENEEKPAGLSIIVIVQNP